MKLVGLVLLGIIASIVFFFLVFMSVETLLKALTGDAAVNTSEGAVFLLAVFMIWPIAFLSGGIVTGYLSYYEIENKRSLLLMAPALYVNLVWMGIAAVQFALGAFIGANPPGFDFVTGLLAAPAIALLWYLASWAGALLGYYLRGRFAKWRYGD